MSLATRHDGGHAHAEHAGWLLSPMFAALAMSLSSASVVANALRLRARGSRDATRDS